MRTRALRSKLTMKRPINSDVDALFHASTKPKIDDVLGKVDDPSIKEAKKNHKADVTDSMQYWMTIL